MDNLLKVDNFTQFGPTQGAVRSGRFGIAALWSSLRRRYQNRRAIAALAALDDRMLRDIGLFRPDIELAVRHGRSKR